jgi:hypothetical protein
MGRSSRAVQQTTVTAENNKTRALGFITFSY